MRYLANWKWDGRRKRVTKKYLPITSSLWHLWNLWFLCNNKFCNITVHSTTFSEYWVSLSLFFSRTYPNRFRGTNISDSMVLKPSACSFFTSSSEMDYSTENATGQYQLTDQQLQWFSKKSISYREFCYQIRTEFFFCLVVVVGFGSRRFSSFSLSLCHDAPVLRIPLFVERKFQRKKSEQIYKQLVWFLCFACLSAHVLRLRYRIQKLTGMNGCVRGATNAYVSCESLNK